MGKLVYAIGAAALVTTLGGGVEAQSFTYRSLNGVQQVPFVLDTGDNIGPMPGGLSPTQSEFTRDPWGDVRPTAASVGGIPPTTTRRVAANLRQRYRIIGNPFIRNAAVRFDWLNLNPNVFNGASDRVELQWTLGTASILDGVPALPATLSVAGTSTNTLTFPGMVFQFVTGPDTSSFTPVTNANESESWGFRTSDIQVTGNGSQGATSIPTLSVYDSVIGLLLTTDDVVRARVASTGHPMSVALWLPSADPGDGLILWARCGALPTASAWLRRVPTNSSGGAFFQIDPNSVECSGQQIYLSVTNTSPRNRAFRLAVMSTRNDRIMDGVKVGVAWDASAAQMNDIRQSFRQAAWQLFGITGGSQLVRSFRYYHNAIHCDDPNPADEYACYGSGCQVCLSPNAGQANYNGIGKTTLYGFDEDFTAPPGTTLLGLLNDSFYWNQADWMQGGSLIVHEFGHHYAAMDDEYQDISGAKRRTCHHTWMGESADNAFTFCTPANHRATGLDWNNMRSHLGPSNFVGVNTFQYGSATSGWEEMWGDGELAAPFPSYQTQEVIRMRPFWTNTEMGRCDFGC